jgi:Skp family chaperone for outer membrane proteins
MRQHNRTEFKNADDRLNNLGKAIDKEIQDRITESDHDIGRTQNELTNLQNAFDTEVQTRIDREKEILQNLDDEKYNLHKKIDNERTDKSLSFGNFRDDINGQLKRQHKFIEAF